MVKTLPTDKLLTGSGGDTSSVAALGEGEGVSPLSQPQMNQMVKYSLVRHLESTDKWVSPSCNNDATTTDLTFLLSLNRWHVSGIGAFSSSRKHSSRDPRTKTSKTYSSLRWQSRRQSSARKQTGRYRSHTDSTSLCDSRKYSTLITRTFQRLESNSSSFCPTSNGQSSQKSTRARLVSVTSLEPLPHSQTPR